MERNVRVVKRERVKALGVAQGSSNLLIGRVSVETRVEFLATVYQPTNR